MRVHCREAGQSCQRVTRVVVAAHEDDETFGCGGLLAKYCDESAVVPLSGLDEERALEFKNAQLALGYGESFFFNLPAGRAGEDMPGLVGMLSDPCARTRLVERYMPFPSVDQDRAAAFEAYVLLCRPSPSDHRWVSPLILMYGVVAGGIPNGSTDVRWNIYEPLEESDLDHKIAAARAYRSRRDAIRCQEGAIKGQAHDVGSVRMLPWAEQFAVVPGSRGGEISGRLLLTGAKS